MGVDGRTSARATARALRRARRRHYLREGDWVDSLYKAYIVGILAAVGLFYGSVALGADFDAAALHDVEQHGAAVLGLAVAVLVLLGLRSGAHGGPLAPESADVVVPPARTRAPRTEVLRAARGPTAPRRGARPRRGRRGRRQHRLEPARRRTGRVAARRRCLRRAGVAARSGDRRWSRPGVRLRASATPTSSAPCSWSGRRSTSRPGTPRHRPRRSGGSRCCRSTFAARVLGSVIALGARGSRSPWPGSGTCRSKHLRDRARLVGELRFAATLQDMRSVIVLHRELAQELPRTQPVVARPGDPRRTRAGSATGAGSRGGR